MNEAEWMTCTDPRKMLAFLLGTDDTPWMDESRWQPAPSERKLRLLACAWLGPCALGGENSCYQPCIAYNEEDIMATTDPLGALDHLSVCCYHPAKAEADAWKATLTRCLFGNPWQPPFLWVNTVPPDSPLKERRTWLIRDWLTWNGGTVRRMAEQIDTQQSWGDLPILADMLEEVGCPAEVRCPACQDESGYRVHCTTCEGSGRAGHVPNPLLSHLRGPGLHARGCHALDVLLNRE